MQTLTVFVTGVSWKPLSAEQVISPAIPRVTWVRASLSVSSVLVTSAPVTASVSTSQARSGEGLPDIYVIGIGFFKVHMNNSRAFCLKVHL